MHSKSIFLYFFLGVLVFFCGILEAGDLENATHYQLAIIHARAVNPDLIFSNSPIKPEDAVISEFEWILETLENRCVNSKNDIAKIIIEAWRLIRQRGYDLTLLEAARSLSLHARNRALFGNEKINFRATSGLWTRTHRPKK